MSKKFAVSFEFFLIISLFLLTGCSSKMGKIPESCKSTIVTKKIPLQALHIDSEKNTYTFWNVEKTTITYQLQGEEPRMANVSQIAIIGKRTNEEPYVIRRNFFNNLDAKACLGKETTYSETLHFYIDP